MKSTIYLCDDNNDVLKSLEIYFANTEDFDVVGTATNGQDAYNDVIRLKPDFLILDVIMPVMDGIEVLEKLKENASINSKKTYIVMTSGIGHDSTTAKAMELGAEYYVMKPYNLDNLIKRLREIRERNISSFDIQPVKEERVEINDDFWLQVRKHVTEIMIELGVPANVSGYTYIRDGIIFAIEDPTNLSAMTKALYPLIADKNNTSASRVERAIRHAIELAFTRGNIEKIRENFGFTVNDKKSKPTNSEFIARISDEIRLKMNI